MKLRQKLAVVLASAMAVTAVPVVTMATTTNTITKSVSVLEKNQPTTAAVLTMKFQEDSSNSQEFYLTLTNAKWLTKADNEAVLKTVFDTVDGKDGKEWVVTKDGITIKYYRQNDTTVRVNLETAATEIEEDTKVKLPLAIKPTGGEVSVAVEAEGSNGDISESNLKVTTTGEKAASIMDMGDLNSFYDKGELTKITLRETFLGSWGAKDMILKVTLDDTDFEFVSSSKVKVEGTYGFNFGAVNTADNDDKVKFVVDKDDKSTAYLWISKDLQKTNSIGRLEITGIKVRSEEDDLATGKLEADITTVSSFDALPNGGAELDKSYTDVAVANIAAYGASIIMKDEKAVDIIAGRDEEVEFTVKENIDDVLVGGRTITLALKDNEDATDKQFFMVTAEQMADPMKIISDNTANVVEEVEFVYKDKDGDTKAGSVYKDKGMARVKEIKVTLADVDTTTNEEINHNNQIDKFKVKTKIYVPVGEQAKKSIEITGDVYGVDEFKSATAVNVVDPFDVTFDQTTFKVGLQDQVAGNITLTESDKERLMKGEVVFSIVDGSKDQDGIVIENKGTLTVTGDLKKADLGEAGNQADKITLKRQSKAASTLSIDDMKVTVDRTVPQGYYDLKLSGSAIDEYDGSYTVSDYIVIGTPNTQDITSGGLTKGTSIFKIGETKYTMNGVEVQMDAAPYVQDPGHIMVPVRFVAQAFGVAKKDILFGTGTVTIFAGERTISLTNGSNVAIVNGSPVTMETAVVIKDNRTYAPAGEIANLLGVAKSWDNATKTATFTNN